jgi:hypothetical protein
MNAARDMQLITDLRSPLLEQTSWQTIVGIDAQLEHRKSTETILMGQRVYAQRDEQPMKSIKDRFVSNQPFVGRKNGSLFSTFLMLVRVHFRMTKSVCTSNARDNHNERRQSNRRKKTKRML